MLNRRAIVLGLLVALACGCAAEERLGRWEGPASAAPASIAAWGAADGPGRCVHTEHYRIYTTIQDGQIVSLLPQLMEGALMAYRQLAPEVGATDRPMDCYIFGTRAQWDVFTRRIAGPDAKVYLQIRSGGYTVGDRYALYYIGREGTLAVAAHEGWHQYVGRHFAGRLPPFLEEGIACMFESVAWEGNLPRFNLSVNPRRAMELRKAMDAGRIQPLETMLAMHAGDIVGDRMEKIDAFYAQAWAFARFLWEAENGRHRPALQRLLADAAAGGVRDPGRSHAAAGAAWNRGAGGAMLEQYLGMSLRELDGAYRAFLHKVAYEQFSLQWRS